MAKYLVTGAAGFIGSHLSEALLNQGESVVGVDAFIPYYPRPIKEANLSRLTPHSNFEFHELDLRDGPIKDIVGGVDVVIHMAAMAGLAKSWTDFDLYQNCNLQATQRLLEAVKGIGLQKFVYISTSSVYGRFSAGDESLPTRPISPYGVTKLASENLCRAFFEEFELPLVVLRYFSVYGPGQRPDMGYNKFIKAMLEQNLITVFGDGHQVRGNTYIDDCVAATLAAVKCPSGEVYNVGGGETASVWDILHLLEDILDTKAVTEQKPARPGDQRSTIADTRKLQQHTGWRPKTSLREGLRKQVEWQRKGHM